MKKTMLTVIACSCCVTFISSVMAYGAMGGMTSAMSGARLISGYSVPVDFQLPIGATTRPVVALPSSSVVIPHVEFDATNIPVHELPPLPLTLDDAEKTPD